MKTCAVTWCGHKAQELKSRIVAGSQGDGLVVDVELCEFHHKRTAEAPDGLLVAMMNTDIAARRATEGER